MAYDKFSWMADVVGASAAKIMVSGGACLLTWEQIWTISPFVNFRRDDPVFREGLHGLIWWNEELSQGVLLLCAALADISMFYCQSCSRLFNNGVQAPVFLNGAARASLFFRGASCQLDISDEQTKLRILDLVSQMNAALGGDHTKWIGFFNYLSDQITENFAVDIGSGAFNGGVQLIEWYDVVPGCADRIHISHICFDC